MQSLSSRSLQMKPLRFRDLVLPELTQPVPAAALTASPRLHPVGKPSPTEPFATAATAVGASPSSYMRQAVAASSPAGGPTQEPDFDELLDPRNWDRSSGHRDTRQEQTYFETRALAPLAVPVREPYVDRPCLDSSWPMQLSAGAQNGNVCSGGKAHAALNLSMCNRRFMAHSHKRTFRGSGSGSGQVTKRHSMDPLLETDSHALSRWDPPGLSRTFIGLSVNVFGA